MPNPINKVVYGNRTLIDLTNDTVTPEDLMDGVTAHSANGEQISGTLNPVLYTVQSDKTDAQKRVARDNIAAAGRTEVEPLINQWDEQWRLGRWNQTSGNYELMTDRICSANYIPVKPSTQYYVHVPSGFLMVFYDSNFSRISQATLTGAGTFTTPSNTAYMNFTLGTGYGTTYNHDISINYPATYTGYYPAGLSKVEADRINNDTMLSMDGYISPVINGVGNYKSGNEYHKRIGRVDLGTLNWSKNTASGIAGLFYASPPADAKKITLNEIGYYTLAYTATSATNSANQFAAKADKSLWYHVPTTNFQIYIEDSTYTDAAAFKAAMQGVYLYYELATEEVRNIDGTEIGDSLGKLGNAIVNSGWNQILVNGNFVNAGGWSLANATSSAANNILTVTPSTVGNNTLTRRYVTVEAGHKYYFTADVSLATANTTTRVNFLSQNVFHSNTTSWEKLSGIATASSSANEYFAIRDTQGVGAFAIKNAMVVDLTEIFGVGNEPSSEQFRQLFPDDYYPFATPSIGKLGDAIANGGWNQLVPMYFFNAITQNGVAFTQLDNGSYSVVGTATANATTSKTLSGFVVGHKYFFRGVSGFLGNDTGFRVENSPNVYDTGSGNMFVASATALIIRLLVHQGVTINAIWKPQIFDLTKIFGAGNEPSIEQFRQLFPDDYYPYHVYQVTNRNLLDNPWFTVNQRNFSSWDAATGTMSVDRWLLTYGSGGVTASFANGVMTFQSKTGSSSGYIRQKFENPEDFDGKQYTLSVLMDDWSVKSGTIMRTNGSTQWAYDDASLRIGFTSDNGFSVAAVGTYVAKIRAAKLELGSVSTLANDFPPNYAEELAKCQRYFVRLEASSTASYFGLGMRSGTSSTDRSLIVPVSLPATMRAKPTVTVSDPIVCLYAASMKVLTDATVTVGAWTKSNIIPLTITHSEIRHDAAHLLWKNSGYIDFSADL